MSYLGQFIFPEELSNSTEIRLYYSGTVVSTIEFYLQNPDGSYPNSATDSGTGGGGNTNPPVDPEDEGDEEITDDDLANLFH